MLSSPATAQADVHALLESAPGPALMTALSGLDVAQLDAAEQLVVLEALERQQRWVAAQSMSATVAVAGAQPIDSDDFIREDVRAALHLSRPAAQDRLDIARALHTTMPATRDALAAGSISYAQASALVGATQLLHRDVVSAVETAVLPRAKGQTIGEFRRAVAKAVLLADPQTLEEQHANAVQGRSVVMYPEPAGMAVVHAVLSAEGARTVMLALGAIAGADTDPGVPLKARCADGLVDLCAGALADPALPRQHGRPAQLHVVTDLPTLLGLAEHPGDLLGYGPIPASVVRRLASDGIWQRLVVEPVTGHLLDVGTTRYRPNQEIADFVLTRSRECTFPTCHTPAPACDIDHVEAFNHEDPGSGGSTSADNNAPSCRRHHRLKTHGGWTVESHGDGSFTWINPRGRRYFSPSTDHRPGALVALA